MIGQAFLPTPELVFEPLLPELVLVVFAMAGLLYEALAKRAEAVVHVSIGLVGVVLAGATSLWLWDWDGPATVLAGVQSLPPSLNTRSSGRSSPDWASCLSCAAETAGFDWEIDIQNERSAEFPEPGTIIRTAPAFGDELE